MSALSEGAQWPQNTGEYDEIFIMIADAQALTDNADNPEKVRQNILQVALDYLACGLTPTRCTSLSSPWCPSRTELSFYYQNWSPSAVCSATSP